MFALVASSIVAYLLSRRLVRRLERLSDAANSLRAGHFETRVPEEGNDEVSQLQHSFNGMATDLERTMGELKAERDRVSGLLESRRQLVAGVSHELRTPVATVRGYLDSAVRRDGALPADLHQDLETAQRELGRLQTMIEDLFTLARADLGRLELRLAPTDISALVRAQVETARPLAWQQRQVQLSAEASGEPSLAVADAQRVAQIVSNLLSNAVRHTPPGGLVVASVEAESGWVNVRVRDTGEGIAAEDVPRIWERFYRGRAGDAGLGLALVKELTESMAGEVSVESVVDQGSTFTVRLPAYRD
jgi:signal transduction histidine kinase